VWGPSLPLVPLSLSSHSQTRGGRSMDLGGPEPPRPQVPRLIGIRLYRARENVSHRAQERTSPRWGAIRRQTRLAPYNILCASLAKLSQHNVVTGCTHLGHDWPGVCVSLPLKCGVKTKIIIINK
jgi:hypothetical protein